MTANIRPALPSDKTVCLELLGKLVEATEGAIDTHAGEVFDSLLDGSRGQVLLAEESTRVLGLAAVSFSLAMRYGGEYCQLEELVETP